MITAFIFKSVYKLCGFQINNWFRRILWMQTLSSEFVCWFPLHFSRPTAIYLIQSFQNILAQSSHFIFALLEIFNGSSIIYSIISKNSIFFKLVFTNSISHSVPTRVYYLNTRLITHYCCLYFCNAVSAPPPIPIVPTLQGPAQHDLLQKLRSRNFTLESTAN